MVSCLFGRLPIRQQFDAKFEIILRDVSNCQQSGYVLFGKPTGPLRTTRYVVCFEQDQPAESFCHNA